MKSEIAANNKNEIILYQPDNAIKLEVRVENETVWLTQDQIALLFGTQRPAITKHLGNIFKSGELDEKEVCSILELTTIHGAIAGKMQIQQVKIYNLDAILSVGYRVNSINATMFRRWANRVLKDYILKGYAINQRFEQVDNKLFQHEQKLLEHQKQIDFFVRTSARQRFVSHWRVIKRFGQKTLCLFKNGNVGRGTVEKYLIKNIQ